MEKLDFLSKEVLTNLIILNQDEKKVYLNRIKYEFVNHLRNVWSTTKTLEKWYKKYDSPFEDDIYFKDIKNVVYKVLNSEKPKYSELSQEGFNEDTEQIQDEFYNYNYGLYLNNAIAFINEQLNQIDPSRLKEMQITDNPIPKLKTTLSQEQLAYLFKM